MNKKPKRAATASKLRRVAESRLRRQAKHPWPRGKSGKREVGSERLLHELQVHQVELEMQNTELQEARDCMEASVEKYTDLYDFAPVGYFSLDDQSRILEVNLTGAALLGVDRSRLIHRRLPVAPESQAIFLAFLKRVFVGTAKQACEATLLKANGSTFWASLHGIFSPSAGTPGRWCRVAISDITSLKQIEEARLRMKVLTIANEELTREISRRKVVEEALKESEKHQGRLLEQSRHMQKQLRHLSHQILHAQEEERKRISRELHDDIVQTLTGINVRLASLRVATLDGKSLHRKIADTQQLVERSVKVVHQFARELRPSVLDDLGLIPALHSFVKSLVERSHLRVSVKVFAAVEQLDGMKRTVLYRVAQEALTNVARHAKATHADVIIEKTASSVHMQIKDDGKSFPVQQTLHDRKFNRLGLLGMRERVEMVGGRFNVESAPGEGTTIDVQIPLQRGWPATRRRGRVGNPMLENT